MGLCCCLGFVAVAILVWVASGHFITPNRRPLEPRHLEVISQPSEFGLDLEAFSVVAEDGTSLAALLASPAENPGAADKSRRMADRLGLPLPGGSDRRRGTVLILHGRSGVKEDMLAVAERFVAGGFRCIVYDARAHGESGGEVCTFGHLERGDFVRVLDESLSRLGSRGEDSGPVCAVGISLGASVILQSLPNEPRLAAVVAVAPFAELPEIVTLAAKRTIHPALPGWLLAGTMKAGGFRAGFDPYAISPIRSLSASQTPVFFAHGSRDEVIPADHSARLHAVAVGPKILRLVPEGNHGNVLAWGGDELYEEMIRFFLATIGS